MTSNLNLDLDPRSSEMRIAEFKGDPEKMRQVDEFLNDLLDKAKVEAEARRHKQKGKLETFGFQNGTKRIGAWSSRARTSARVFATRVFTAICNCTNSVKSAVVNRN